MRGVRHTLSLSRWPELSNHNRSPIGRLYHTQGIHTMSIAKLNKLSKQALRSLYIELAAQYASVCTSNDSIRLSGDAAELKRLCAQELATVCCPTPAEWVEAAQFVLYNLHTGLIIHRDNNP